MKRILILKLGAIGDVLMTTPFVRQLKKGLDKDVIVDYISGKGSSQALIGNIYLNELFTFDELIFSKINILKIIKFIFKLRKLSKKYDSIFILDKHRIFYLVVRLAGFKKTFGFDRLGKIGILLKNKIYWDSTKREVEYYLDLLKLIKINPDYNDQKYDIFGGIISKLKNDNRLNKMEKILVEDKLKNKKNIDIIIESIKNNGKKIIGISTGGGNAVTNKIHGNKDCRRWDMKNRTELSNELIKKGYVVLLLGINSDRELHINNNNFYNLLGKYNIIETIYLINNIDFLVTCDNGIMHFGGCTETKIVALFGPTDPRYKFPFINKNTNQPIGWIWKEERQCYDCYGRYDKCNGNEINKITVRDVLNKIK